MTQNLSVIDLDFDSIKNNLIEFLLDQNEFKDYDFTGSAMNTLIDVLTYATHYMGVHANLSLNEVFLDTALIRSSVVSKAKEIGYMPQQNNGAKSSFTLTYTDPDYPPGVASFNIPKWTRFVAETETGTSLPFITYSDQSLVTVDGNPGETLSGTIQIIQGVKGIQSWKYQEGERYIVSQPNVSLENLEVKINTAGDIVVWTFVNSIATVTDESEVFFVSENKDSIEIYFGNDVIGKKPVENSIITATYVTNKGVDGNYLINFSIPADINEKSRNQFSISNVEKSYDGTNRETIQSIKVMAPLDYQRQNRVVTLNDYRTTILKYYNNVESINVWGGEDNDPPAYGRVFCSIKPKTGEKISRITREYLLNDVLKKFNVVGIVPDIIDPEYVNINLSVIVNYNKDITTLLKNELEVLVKEYVDDFFNSEVYEFDDTFKYSKLLAIIDSADKSITSNLTSVEISKFFIPILNGTGSYYIVYDNEIEPGSIYSEEWVNTSGSLSKLKDDGNGYIDLYINDSIYNKKVGSVNYIEGKIDIVNWDAEIITSNERLYITSTPVSNNLKSKNYNILVQGLTTVTAEPITL